MVPERTGIRFIEQASTFSICFEAALYATDQSTHTIQCRIDGSQYIFEHLHQLSDFCKTGDLPTIQGYYACLWRTLLRPVLATKI
jgi:hypothetical protein